MKTLLPNFKTTYRIVGGSFAFLSASLFAKGLIESMKQFNVPKETLNSPHYFDAIFWVYVHMFVIGVLIFLMGNAIQEKKQQIRMSLFLFIATCFYTYLDFRSSDSFLGNGLYQGDASVIPAIIGLIVNLLFFQLLVRNFSKS
jgi:hypothetical protein